ncbi:MAG: hypothetical protein KAQ83_01645 [Nanoarchaeota archaeon]|nr:hypothetical protein [Nanoarchaeota archaeon]
MKKAQITLFLLIPLVLLAAFVLVFYFANIASQSNAEQKAETLFSDTMQEQTFNNYVEECIATTTEDGIQLISKQGGFFFQDQKGSIITWEIPTTKSNNQDIAYQIYNPSPRIVSSDYLYPCYTAKAYVPPIMKGEYCHENYNHDLPYYTFGTTGDPIKSVNPDLCEAYNYSRSGYSCFCQECTGFSIETQLENYITINLPSCLNFSTFYDYDVEAGNLSVDLLVENRGITTNINYPLKITTKGQNSFVKKEKFATTIPIRLKQVYEAARNIIGQEINNLSFNFPADAYKYNIPNLNFEKIKTKDNSYVFILNDSTYLIHGENYIFQFAVKNRPPALDYYNPDNCYFDGEYYNICAVEGETINIAPIAYDPDNDQILYNYEGWKTNYDSLWTTTGSNPELHQEIFETNYNHWQNSEDYLGTKRIASYKTNNYDIGKHDLTIYVYDAFGLQDKQTLKILINERPNAYFIAHSIYPDIAKDKISSEDPIFLNATYSKQSFSSSNLQYQWENTNTGEEWPYSYNNKILSFLASLQTKNIFQENTEQNFKLTVLSSSNLIGQQEKQLEILECLPHRENSAPYPFNTYNNDPYPNTLPNKNDLLANHTCCSDGTDGFSYGQIKTNNICYHLVDYGCSFNFNPEDSRFIDPAFAISTAISNQELTHPTMPQPTDQYKDVYRREVKVLCGNSGNKCDGQIVVEITPLGQCENICKYQYQQNPNTPEPGLGCS